MTCIVMGKDYIKTDVNVKNDIVQLELRLFPLCVRNKYPSFKEALIPVKRKPDRPRRHESK